MAQWIVRTQGDYPHLLPYLVESVVSKKRIDENQMQWVVEMSDKAVEELRQRAFVASIDPATATSRS